MKYITKSPTGKYIKKPPHWPQTVIAVTGLPGSGKSTFAKILSKHGVSAIDTDKLVRDVTKPGSAILDKLARVTGSDIILPDRSLNKAMLRKLITSDKTLKKKVEALIHPAVFRLLDQQLRKAAQRGVKIAVVEVPLLFEAGWEPYFDKTVCVIAPEAECIKRIAKRNRITEEEAAQWLALQMSQTEKASKADYLVSNNGNLEELESKAKSMLSKIEQEMG